MPSHAIIIPHFDDLIRLHLCLEALAANDLSDAEVVLVDNGSPQPLDNIGRSFPFVRIVTEPRKGAAHARNRGVAETKAPILCFLDCDCVPARGWPARARQASALADIVGGAVTVFDETSPPRTGAQAFETVFAFDNRAYVERKGFSVTANLVTRRDVFERVGPFVDGLSEDHEWCLRATGLGFRLAFDERLVVAHPTRSDWPALRRKWLRLTREMFLLHLQRKGERRGRLSWALRAAAVLLSGGAHLAKVLLSPRLDSPGERLRGAATLICLRALRSYWMLRQAIGLPV
jgi:GT2 family glycosyltransferase